MKKAFVERTFRGASLKLIEQSNAIISEYARMGYKLTLRQLYYQLVSRDIIPNNMQSYKRVGSIINDARLAGMVDWDAIEDRTRNVRTNSHWIDPAQIIRSAAHSYAIDKWADQEYRPEVWIEKDALVGVISRTCQELDVPFFACRGYVSQSEMYDAGGGRFMRHYYNDQTPVIIHLGDHDPSGIDMTRDNRERLSMFMGRDVEVLRIALNFDQIERFNPPPNPAKMTDSRVGGYIAKFGRTSWELDALPPDVLNELIRTTVLSFRNDELWAQAVEREEEGRRYLMDLADREQ